MNVGVIGGADGPTAIFLTQSHGRLNLFGLVIVALMLVPSVVYLVKNRTVISQAKNKVLLVAEVLAWCVSAFLMIVKVNGALGIPTIFAFVLYYLGDIILAVAQFAVWIVHIRKNRRSSGIALVAITACIFLLSGITTANIPLVVSGSVFLIAGLPTK